MIQNKYYDRNYWLEFGWSADWVKDLPISYWKEVLDSTLRNFAAWVPENKWVDYLESTPGRNQICEQLYVRLSQASESFIPWVSRTLMLRDLRVLEIGCGTGSSTAAMARAGAKVTGLDIAPGFLAVAETRLSSLGLQAEFRALDPDWLTSLSHAKDQLAIAAYHQPTFDAIVCYALLEHLTPNERLTLLSAIRDMIGDSAHIVLIVYETPNRFAPVDWHSTRVAFPDCVPDEIAQAYLAKRLAKEHPWRKNLEAFDTSAGRLNWYRGGRGVSFHEFDIAFGMENIDVLQDGYAEEGSHIRSFSPNADYERALADVFENMQPPVPRAFCRPTLDVILRVRIHDGLERPRSDLSTDDWKRHQVYDNREAELSVNSDSDSKSAFGMLYERGWWGSAESKSGRGSELAATEQFRAEFEAWLREHADVRSLLDAPCGDFNWMQALRWPHPVQYLGGEVVPQLVAELTERYAGPDRRFCELDIITQDIPNADLWLCRDAIIHFPFAQGAVVVHKFLASNIRYLLATTFPAETNDVDCTLGGYHKVNLALSPFDLGPPERLLRDPAENNQTDRFIGVWSKP